MARNGDLRPYEVKTHLSAGFAADAGERSALPTMVESKAPRFAVTEEVRVRAGRGYWRSATVVAVPGPAFNFVWVQVPGESTIRPCLLGDLA